VIKVGKQGEYRTIPGCVWAVTPELIKQFAVWWRKEKPGADMPQGTEVFIQHFGAWLTRTMARPTRERAILTDAEKAAIRDEQFAPVFPAVRS